MKTEMIILKQISMRGRMAFGLACVERLAAKYNFQSSKYMELLGLLWEFTETENFGEWNLRLTGGQWEHVRAFGFWLINDEGRPKPNSNPFPDAPEVVVAMLGLCAAIGEAHLYGAFVSEESECLLEKVLAIMAEEGVPLPPLDRFQRNDVNATPDFPGIGFPASRSFYLTEI